MKFVALFRGINVSGQKIVKMEALRASLATLGWGEVRTYVQSGNVIFEGEGAANAIATASKKIRARVVRDFGFDAEVLVVGGKDLARVVKSNPFLKERGADPKELQKKLYVSFLSGSPGRGGVAKLTALSEKTAGVERFSLASGVSGAQPVIYLCMQEGFGRALINNNSIEKALGVTATTRNWNTVLNLHALAETC